MKIPIKIREEAIRLSLLGETCESISKILNVSTASVNNFRKETDFQFRKCGEHKRVNFFNESYFEKINEPIKAYWLGFIFADGCMHQKTWCISIGLARKDKCVLESFAQSIGAHINSIKDHCQENPISRIRLNSKKMYNDFLKLGMSPRKSLTLEPPKINKEFFWDFILGYFDGDGCVVKNANTINIACSLPMANWLSDVFLTSDIKSKIISHGKIFYVNIYGLENIHKFIKNAYRNELPFLKRKKDIFDAKKKESQQQKQTREMEIVFKLKNKNKTYKEIAKSSGLSFNRVHHLIKCINQNQKKIE